MLTIKAKAPDKVKNSDGKERRATSKIVLLALSYGMGASSLAEKLGKTKQEAQEIFDNFFMEFPQVKKLIEVSRESLKKNGYVEDIFGRRRHLPDINLPPYEVELVIKPVEKQVEQQVDSNFNPFLECADSKNPLVAKYEEEIKKLIAKNNQIRLKHNPQAEPVNEMSNKAYLELSKKAAKEGVKIQANTVRIAQADRQCLNARIQGSAASLTKLAMVEISRDKDMQEWGVKILAPIHDEVLLQCPLLYSEQVSAKLHDIMLGTAERYVKADMKWASDNYNVSAWYEDNYSAELRKEFTKYTSGDNRISREEAMEKIISAHSETPAEMIRECIEDNKDVNFEFIDN